MIGPLNKSGASPANSITLSKRRYEVRTADGTKLLWRASAEQGERGIADGVLALVRSGNGDYLIRRTVAEPGIGNYMAPNTTERPRDKGRYIASDALLQHRGEGVTGRFSNRHSFARRVLIENGAILSGPAAKEAGKAGAPPPTRSKPIVKPIVEGQRGPQKGSEGPMVMKTPPPHKRYGGPLWPPVKKQEASP